MDKFECRDEITNLYTGRKKSPVFVDVPEMKYIMFDGVGHPNEQDFQVACEAIYTISYIIKFEISRKKMLLDYKVSYLEVEWDLDKTKERTSFAWTMMILQPDFVNKEIFNEAIQIARDKGKEIEYERLRFAIGRIGKAVQMFHLGDYNRMNETLKSMTDFAELYGYDCDQFTHDIYLNDTRKTKKENAKTIMRVMVYERNPS